MADIVTPFTTTLTKSQLTPRIKQLVRAKIGNTVDSFTTFGQLRQVLNDSAPVDSKINEWEPVSSFVSKLNSYHNDASRIALSSVFTASNQVLMDFTDATKVFQDSLTNPVTTAGQSIGLVADELATLSLGPNLISNGTFATDTVWSKGTNWTISGGSANKTVASSSAVSQIISAGLVGGRTYRVTGNVTLTAGSITPSLTGGTSQAGVAISASGYFEQYITAVAGNTNLSLTAGSTFLGSIDNITLQEVQTALARQNTTSLRGTWGIAPAVGRRNTVTFSEPTSAAQVNTQIGAVFETGTIPGFNGCVRIPDNASTKYVYMTGGGRSSTQYTFSFYAQLDNGGVPLGGGNGRDFYCLVGGSSVTSNSAFTVTNVSGSLYRVKVTGTTGTSNIARFGVVKSTSSSATGITVSGFQVELGNTMTNYQRVVSANEIYETGVASVGSWRPDLVDDTLNFNLTTAADGELFFMGRSGSWRESRPSTTGTSVTIGATGSVATPGILRAVGDVLAMGFRAGTMTTDEWELLKRRYSGLGGKGELLLGSEMITNGTFTTDTTGWTVSNGNISVSGGRLVVENTGAANATAYQVLTTVIGQPYFLSGEVTGIVVGGLPRLGAGTGIANNSLLQFLVTVAQTTTSFRGVFIASGTSTWINALTNSTVLGVTAQFDNISVKPLTPEW